MNATMQHFHLGDNGDFHKSLPRLSHRDQLPALFNAMGLLGYGAEVGVQAGKFARLLREQWQGEVLYLIDRWCYEPTYRDIVNVSQEEQEQLYQQVQAMFDNHPGVRVLRQESLAAASLFKDTWLDWVYLDADHSQAAVAKDLLAWWPRLRRGGIFAGHDYCDGTHHSTEFGVKSAVDEFARQHNLKVVTTAEAHFPSWYCRKP